MYVRGLNMARSKPLRAISISPAKSGRRRRSLPITGSRSAHLPWRLSSGCPNARWNQFARSRALCRLVPQSELPQALQERPFRLEHREPSNPQSLSVLSPRPAPWAPAQSEAHLLAYLPGQQRREGLPAMRLQPSLQQGKPRPRLAVSADLRWMPSSGRRRSCRLI
jgi:hypothetical protein